MAGVQVLMTALDGDSGNSGDKKYVALYSRGLLYFPDRKMMM